MRINVRENYSAEDPQISRVQTYALGCTVERRTTATSPSDRITITNTTTDRFWEGADSCELRFDYVPSGKLHLRRGVVVNVDELSPKINESILRVVPTDAYSCSKSSCVTLQYEHYENEGKSVRVYDESFSSPVHGVSTTVVDSRGRSVYVDLIYEPGNTNRMLQNFMLIVITIGVERFLKTITSYVA